LSFYLNGMFLGSTAANPTGQCRCDPPLQTFTVSNSALIAAAWHTTGNNAFRTVKSGTGTALAWVRARLQSGAQSQTVCVFDFNGGDCTEMNLCTANYTFGTVDQTTNVVEPFSTPVMVIPYTNGQLPPSVH